MTTLGIQEDREGKVVDWLEQVSDAEYSAPVQGQAPAAAPQPTTAQRLMGDFAPSYASSPTTCSLARSGPARNCCLGTAAS